MADDQTGEFFMPPADDAPAFAAPDDQTGAFFMPPPDDAPAFAAPAFAAPAFAAPAAGVDESQAGDIGSLSLSHSGDGAAVPPAAGAVLLGEPPSDGDFLLPAPEAGALLLGDPPAPSEAPSEAEAPPAVAAAAEGFVVVEAADDDDAAEDDAALPPVESSHMAKWNEEWQATLLRRREEEGALKASRVEQARADVAAFQAEREKRREGRMARNRSDEQDMLEAMEADLENDNAFQRVVKMIELSQDNSEGAADTGRMKDVLVLLKNEPKRVETLTAAK